MADIGARVCESPRSAEDDRPEPKRRKVRKGTQSCWECKRRKIKCSFATPDDTVCQPCKRRRTACISQEYRDEPAFAPVSGDDDVSRRLGHVEMVVEQLALKCGATNVADELLSSLRGNKYDVPGVSRSSSSSGNPSQRPSPNVASPTLQKHCLGTLLGSPRPALPTFFTFGQGTQSAKKYEDELSVALFAAWPSPGELDRILSTPASISGLLCKAIGPSQSNVIPQNTPSPRDILRLPLPGCHPVLIAQKLLILGTYLQGISLSNADGDVRLYVRHRDIMSRVVETAVRLVTSNDELVASIEGIECIMIESMYHNNSGNLHRAWLSTRRAMMIAQLMGLHRGGSQPLVKVLEPGSRQVKDANHLWFRLVHADRYLSFMLGLPQNSPENSFATPSALESCSPSERMERITSVAAGHILQRNYDDIPKLAATHEIDKLLQKASASMPAQWWLKPNLSSDSFDDTKNSREMIQIMNQLVHYNLLLQLHMPYMLRSTADQEHDYNRITAVNASRELLARFVLFRTVSTSTAYCRGVDFLALIASAVLCLAHISARQQQQSLADDTGFNSSKILNSLVHQRPSDRGLMERTLGSMETMARASADVIATKVASILQPLLIMEADDSGYDISSTLTNNERQLECGGTVSNDGHTLWIDLPYFGTVTIERRRIPESTSAVSTTLEQQQPDLIVLNRDEGIQDEHLLPHNLTPWANDWDLQGVDAALFEGIAGDIAGQDVAEGETLQHWIRYEPST